MAALPDTIVVLLEQAENDLDAAVEADKAHQASMDALAVAMEGEARAGQTSLDAHKTALDAANAALAALKQHFGIA